MSNELYSNKLFLNAVLPLLKHIAADDPGLSKKWTGVSGICQVSCKTEEGYDGTHFIIEEGEWTVKRGCYDGKPDVDLVFSSRKHLNNFFMGKVFPFPKMKGLFSRFSLFTKFFANLLKMASLLGQSKPPKDEREQDLLTKCMFYLLSTGISTLNKMGHPTIKEWTEKSPDRVYAWAVEGKPELSAYIRIKAGNSRAGRGEYTRSMPFFTMKFDSSLSALGILLEIDDMIEATTQQRLMMVGGPEFGAQLGDHMMLVGGMIK